MTLRNIKAVFIAVLLGICAIAVCACKRPPEPTVYSITYSAQDGGTVYGNLYQSVTEGQDGTQVVAVPNEGYKFIGWSDGTVAPSRTELSVGQDVSVTAIFEKIEVYELVYSAGEGNVVIGDCVQSVYDGESGSTVYVKSLNGYRFVEWSDGNTDRERKDSDITDDLSVSAVSEKISVDFYSDGYLVRRAYLADIVDLDLSQFVGYRSKSEFLGWKFCGEVVVSGSFTDALYALKQQFRLFGISDADDIELEAVYKSDAEGAEPYNYITIAHALGGYDGESYQNSKEAFETNYALGCRFFEVDLTFTSDGYLVASHDSVECTFNEFIADIQPGRTPLSLNDLIGYMTEYKDIYFDFDTLRWSNEQEFADFGDALRMAVGENLEVLDRIIVEITPLSEGLISILKDLYDGVGITKFLYTEGWYTDDLEEFENVCKKCNELGIQFASIPAVRWISKEKIDICHEYGIFTMAYTVNSISEMYKLYDMGVDCIFTDFVLL